MRKSKHDTPALPRRARAQFPALDFGPRITFQRKSCLQPFGKPHLQSVNQACLFYKRFAYPGLIEYQNPAHVRSEQAVCTRSANFYCDYDVGCEF